MSWRASSTNGVDAGLGAQRPIIQYWHSETPPEPIPALFKTYVEQNPDLQRIAFNESTAHAFIGERLGGRYVAAFRACAVRAMQADYLRYCALLELGGFYADADSRCIASLRPLLDGVVGAELFERPTGPIVNGFVAVASPQHPLLALTLEIATENIEHRAGGIVWLATGPGIFTGLHLLHRLGSFETFLDAFDGLLEQRLRQPRQVEGLDLLLDQRKRDEARFSARLMCQTIGDMGRVTAALADVTISPFAKLTSRIRGPGVPLPYKATSAHWTKVTSSIFK